MKRIGIDESKCKGCLNCTYACIHAERIDNGKSVLPNFSNKQVARNYIYQRNQQYYPVFCGNCDEPDCLNACMSGALKKNIETGIVEYDMNKCSACFMCVMSCRFGFLRPAKDGESVVRCTFCQDTVENEPQCVKACPTKALFIKEVE